MNTFQQAGEAMLLAQEGNRQIAVAVGQMLQRFVRRLANGFNTAFSTTPGMH